MKLTINTKELLKALQTVGNLIKPQNAIPMLENVLFELKPGKLTLTADNLEVRSTIEMDVTFDKEYRTCIPFAFLVNILKGFPNGPVDLIFNEKNVELKSTIGEYKIPIVPEDSKNFPSKSEAEPEHKVMFNALDLAEALKKAYLFADKSNADSLSSVLFWVNENGTRIVGCTKHVFYEHTLENKGLETKILLSLPTVQYLTSSIDIDEDIEISYTKNQVFFKLENREISATQYDGKYPSYDVILDKVTGDKIFTIDKDCLFPSLKRILNISDKNSYAVAFNFSPNKLELDFTHKLLNIDAKEKLEVDYVGSDFSIGLNVNNLNNILNAVDGDISMEFSDAMNPGLLKSENTRCLFTPMAM